jgi:hypothetical protein
MRTEQLIADLAGGVVPVRRLSPPAARFAWWGAVALVTAVVAIGKLGTRPDLAVAWTRPAFLAAALLAVATAAAAAIAALVLAVPGAERSAALRIAAFALLAAWAAFGAGAVVAGGTDATGWTTCFLRVLMIGALPAAVLLALVRRAAPVRRGAAAGLAALGAIAVGSAAIPFACPSNAPAHALLGHFGPAIVAGLVAALAAPLLLRRT